MATERTENRITLPQHIRSRAQQRASDLGYTALVDYVTELVMVDTSPLIARQVAQVPQSPPQQETPVVTINAGGEWGPEV